MAFELTDTELLNALIPDLRFALVANLNTTGQAAGKLRLVKYLSSVVGELRAGSVVATFAPRDAICAFVEAPTRPGSGGSNPALDSLLDRSRDPANPLPRPAHAEREAPHLLPALSQVVELDVDPDMADNTGDAVWVAANLDLAPAVAMFRNETDLIKQLRGGAKRLRKQAMVQSLVGQLGLTINNPLLAPPTDK